MNEKLSGQFSQNQIDFILKKKTYEGSPAEIEPHLEGGV
jgi:hypothetical protein